MLTQVGGKKELTGRTDLDVAFSNECGRPIANVVTAYNSMMLSILLESHQETGNRKMLDLLKKISPVAWRAYPFPGALCISKQL